MNETTWHFFALSKEKGMDINMKIKKAFLVLMTGITIITTTYIPNIYVLADALTAEEVIHSYYDDVNNKNIDNAYEVVYSVELKIGEEQIPFEILLSSKECTDGTIKIGSQEIPINSQLAKTVGYAHGEAKAYDFTGDGKEEIVLVISGGASGAVQAVQVFGNIDGKWDEIDIPSDIYSDAPEFVKKQLKELDIKMDDSIVYYRSVSFKKEKILIDYHIFSDSGTTAIGTIQKELIYSSDKKRFVLGDTLVTPATNNCLVTASASKRAITIKCISSVKKSSIKGMQVKVATKKSMKNATTYKLDKKEAQKMSYKFTVKSGKVVENKTYYFRVRLKAGNKWTKWSNTKKAKIV